MSYIGNSPALATRIIYRYTIAVAGTTVSGNDDFGKALTYTPGYTFVFVNGIKLIEILDYAASSGSSIVFVNPVQIGDVVEVVAYGTFSLQNTVTPTGGPVANQIAMWTDGTHIEGNSALTFDKAYNILNATSTPANANTGQFRATAPSSNGSGLNTAVLFSGVGGGTFQAFGSDPNLNITILTQGTGAVYIKGTGTNDSAPAGYVGEYQQAANTTSAAVSASVQFVCTSLSLTAGDWDVWGHSTWTNGTLATQYEIEINNTTSLSGTSSRYYFTTFGLNSNYALDIWSIRWNLAATTTLNLIVRPNQNTNFVNGYIFARRRR